MIEGVSTIYDEDMLENCTNLYLSPLFLSDSMPGISIQISPHNVTFKHLDKTAVIMASSKSAIITFYY